MLEAFVHKKRLGKVLSGDAQLGSVTTFPEDVITSAVFGPLQYMSTTAAWDVVRSTLLRTTFGYFRDIQPIRHELLFWKMHPLSCGSGHRSEPDVVFKFFGNGSEILLMLILEVKWDAKLSEHQLVKQRRAFGQYCSEERLYQVLLARSATISSGETRSQLAVSPKQCAAVSWNQVADRVNRRPVWDVLDSSSYAVLKWMNNVQLFLRMLGVIPFDAFDRLTNAVDDSTICSVLSWRLDYWSFEYFSTMSPIHVNETLEVIHWKIE
jgi:hypothetical protein